MAKKITDEHEGIANAGRRQFFGAVASGTAGTVVATTIPKIGAAQTATGAEAQPFP